MNCNEIQFFAQAFPVETTDFRESITYPIEFSDFLSGNDVVTYIAGYGSAWNPLSEGAWYLSEVLLVDTTGIQSRLAPKTFRFCCLAGIVLAEVLD
ncbi:MAG: hypothetical protein V4772_07490 [Pseudomonadota bacterium]